MLSCNIKCVAYSAIFALVDSKNEGRVFPGYIYRCVPLTASCHHHSNANRTLTCDRRCSHLRGNVHHARGSSQAVGLSLRAVLEAIRLVGALVPRHRPLDPFVEGDLGTISEQLLGLLDVGTGVRNVPGLVW